MLRQFRPGWMSGLASGVAVTAIAVRPEWLASPLALMLAALVGGAVALEAVLGRPVSVPGPPVEPAVPLASGSDISPPRQPEVALPPSKAPTPPPPLIVASETPVPDRGSRADFAMLSDRRQQEEEAARLLATMQHANEGLAFMDSGGHFIAASAAMEALAGSREASLPGRHWAEIWPGATLGETPVTLPLPGAPGRRAAVRLIPVPPTCGCAALLTARELPQAPRERTGTSTPDLGLVRRMETQFQHFFEAMKVYTLRLDAEGRVLAANGLWSELGYQPADLQGAFFPTAVHPAFRADIAEVLQRLRGGQAVHRLALQILNRAGEPVRVSAVLGTLTDRGGASQFFVLLEDLQEAARVEAELTRSEERYRHLVESIADGVLLVDQEDAIRFANPAALGILGVQDATGRSLREFQAPDQTTYLRPYREGLRDGSEGRFELEIVRSDGQRRYLRVFATPQFDTRFRHHATLLMLRDETERHAAELDLIRTIAFKSVLEEISDSINGSLDLKALMQSACGALVKYCDATFACALYQEGLEGEPTESVYAQAGRGEAPADLRDFLMHHGRLQEVLQTGERQVVTRRRLAASFGQRASLPEWATSFVASPVVLRGNILAVLYAFTPGPEGFSRESQTRFEQMAAQTASTLAGILLYGEVTARNERLESALEQLRRLQMEKERYYGFLLERVGGPLGQIGDMALHLKGVDRLEAGLQEELRSILGMAAEMHRNLEEFIVTEGPARTMVAHGSPAVAHTLLDLLQKVVEQLRPRYPNGLYAVMPLADDAREALALPESAGAREALEVSLTNLVEIAFQAGESPIVLEAGATGHEAHLSIETSKLDVDSLPDFEESIARTRRLLMPAGGRLSLEWGRLGSLRMTVITRAQKVRTP